MLAVLGLSACDVLIEEIETAPSTPPTIEIAAMDSDYYTVLGAAEHEHDPSGPGVVEYCELDKLERARCVYAKLTSQQRAEQGKRQDIDADLAGWPARNNEVEIPALDDVEDSEPYHGWMMNRSHLLADSLGGDASAENLVTGTRTQNVGSTQVDGEYAGGMAYTERIARDYLDSGAGDACPLYYAGHAELQRRGAHASHRDRGHRLM